jgi:hypothetical protein
MDDSRDSLVRACKADILVTRLEDESRRLDLDRIDEEARRTNTWGSRAHRQFREARERLYEESRAKYAGLPEETLDELLAASEPPV